MTTFEEKIREIALPYTTEKIGQQSQKLSKTIWKAYALYLDNKISAITFAAYAFHIGKEEKK